MKPYAARATIAPYIRCLLLKQEGSIDDRNKILDVAFGIKAEAQITLPDGKKMQIKTSLLK